MSNQVYEVAVLGATGVVGQKVIAMLQDNPKFKITQIAASERSKGKVFGEGIIWNEERPLDQSIANMTLIGLNEVTAPYAISALPSGVAREVEMNLATQGTHVFSNASAYRMNDNVPLMIPEINKTSISLLDNQPTPGKIVTNPNCSTVFLSLALAPLTELGTIKSISVATLQSVSGAGAGLAAYQITGNTIPYISGEEEKIEAEVKKILGCGTQIEDFDVIVHVNRVPVVYGHTLNIHVTYEDNVNVADIEKVYQNWNTKYENLFTLYDSPWFPQPLKNITNYDMGVHIGRIKGSTNPRTIGLTAMGHNLVRGAAGAAITNMENVIEAWS